VAMNAKLAADNPKYELLKAQGAELQRKINANSKALPTETELPAFFDAINRKLIDSGVELVRTSKKPEETVEGFVKVPIDMEVTGTFLQIKRFFASLAQRDSKDDTADDRERIISIENLALTEPKVVGGIVMLDAKFVASTFRVAEEPAGSGAGAGPKPTTAKPTTTTPAQPTGAPMPTGAPLPTNTPAGAKASVNASMEKADKVDRNATGVEEAKTPKGSQ
jgi:Tfp pilus assembly protein PilO